ncbi:MAG TPA: 50S ribosomal protein L7/L12 [Candidatus Portnoybacteria bacterium]|jgi:large subunit ribosomal protein L7/L12|nr:50S ribosomal protein L7/L12 [Candidatus Portnoybacteria bacterium]MDD5752121.1 50S ribosomal protein L7/L12 [Candidatus Portnoybacteria bacterium]HNU97005.1 50S ribosomal protein L7/L12 [Candidatus Portnoybacteria bacterium]HOZ16592.1 50S ribosomal protein L7/L12 [Candidatus Portnoybacteria bacterium]HPH52318.1 50S ribosomal protein L7/L12 [Candidatus Portnoybacteria bacterium]
MTEEKKSSTAEAKADKEIKVPEKFKKLIDEIEKMSVLDLSELVKVLEEKFGVSAMAAMPMMAGAVAGGEAGGVEKAEKTAFNVELKAAGDQKIQVIKIIGEITGLGLKESKAIVDGAPKVVKENVKKEEAEELKAKLEAVGATIELK